MKLLSLYHSLPYPLKVAAASARGYGLRRWRYSRDTERLVAEALERETWPVEKLAAWQGERLAETLEHAARSVPYYRAYWAGRRRNGERLAVDRLEHWPVLTKAEVRAQPRAFLADDYHRERLYEEHTSGTTGTPLTLWQSREALIAWYALFEARCRRWNGVDLHTRWGIFGGQMVAGARAAHPPYWVWNRAFSQLYLSSYHLSARTVTDYLDALRACRVQYLYAYPSAMALLAQLAAEAGCHTPELVVAIGNAEPLLDGQRAVISAAFGCATRSSYGLSEQVCGASECAAGQMHLWPEAGLLEIVDMDGPQRLQDGQTGRMVSSGLLNPAMPLIRYDTGDIGCLRVTGDGAICACGRSLPVLGAIEGRKDDYIVTPDGRRIGRLDPVFKADFPIREAQIVQTLPDAIDVYYAAATGFTAQHLAVLETRLHERLGNMRIVFHAVDAIPRGPNGKFRAVISKIKT